MATMFLAVGGTPAITALIDNFYVKVLSNPLTLHMFTNTDMPRVKASQVQFFSEALGSEVPYTGKE